MAALTSRQEPIEVLKKRAAKIIRRLKKQYPDATVALHHRSPVELLVATILSAQCTDERVNIVTESLFQKYRTAGEYAKADQHELEKVINSTGFFRAKAKSIINCCKALVEQHGGNVPDTMEELVQLAGVGRKTANVILGNVFGKAEGIVVDTHVKRLSQRLGLSKESTPEKIEVDLMNIVPKKDWIALGDLLIWHGRAICDARKPDCPGCPVNDLCPSANTFT
ncbi:MAG TPA: endonuclease III [Bacteroidota bacterium]|nr:endonuclease III [Bacteroidota bacterium]